MKIMALYKYINLYSIFILAIIVRLLFSYSNHVDEQRYIFLSEQILSGNFDLDAGILISAPFFPYLLASIKYLTPIYWFDVLFLLQVLMSSLCIFPISRICFLLFKDNKISMLSALIYAIYPDTFMYVKVVGQEVSFQFFLIFSVYFLIKFLNSNQFRDVIFSAILFSLCFQTKSFILFWSPFIVIAIFVNEKIKLKNKINAALIYTLICLLFTTPIGFYHLAKHNQYILSSNGASVMFWVGNSESAYIVGIKKEQYENENTLKDTAFQMYRIANLSGSSEYLNSRQKWGSPSQVQELFWHSSIQWINTNPIKFIQLRAYYLFRFIFPGHKPPYASFIKLSMIFLYSSLLYLLGFVGLYKAWKQDYQNHLWMLTLWLTMLLFSTIFCTEIRFRTITIDSFLCIYAAFFIIKHSNLIGTLRRTSL